jgi:hypothetical protein
MCNFQTLRFSAIVKDHKGRPQRPLVVRNAAIDYTMLLSYFPLLLYYAVSCF